MKSYSQAAQDLFVNYLHPSVGTFLDIGASHPTELSNTCALEQLGWHGLLVDNDPNAFARLVKERRGPCLFVDATSVNDWKEMLLGAGLWPHITYLSLDIDAGTLAALGKLPLSELRFDIITIEHDAYRFGDGPRAAMRDRLQAAGYNLICADVRHSGLAFEDWLVAPDLMPRAERFRSAGLDYADILNDLLKST